MGSALEQIIAHAAARGWINAADIEAFCNGENIRPDDLSNHLSVTIAHRFLAGSMSFQEADAAINAIQAQIIEDAFRVREGYEFPRPAFAIYEAFDAGEYNHGDGQDPVERFTRPALIEILRQV